MKFNKKQKDTLFKILLTGEIELLCYLLYLIISVNLGDFVWTVEMLRSSLTGLFIQFLKLVFLINGVILFLYIVVFLIFLLKS
ncbi:MAG: hypothetical protein KGD72_08895 [Candidatus Lokiarchaeota archaeon]|nr:hypothetical protein [Candidatus Lokiarchaeota archaeon]